MNDIAEQFISIGEKKSSMPVHKQFLLGIMAGIFIALASQGSNQAIHTVVSVGVGKTVAGALFSCGLILVVVAGGELFTGNNLMIVACLEKKIKPLKMLRGWLVVFLGNFAGSLIIVGLILFSGQLNNSSGMLGGFTIKTAVYKAELDFIQAFCMGVLCNILVCGAVWMAAGAKEISGKIWAVFFPVWLFITSGFEHSVANMFYIPMGILAKGNALWASQAETFGITAERIAALNWSSLIGNLLPVTLGNIAGGAVVIGAGYWIVNLRNK